METHYLALTTIGGWENEVIAMAIGLVAGLLTLTIPKVRQLTGLQKGLVGALFAVIAYLIVRIVARYYFQVQLD